MSYFSETQSNQNIHGETNPKPDKPQKLTKKVRLGIYRSQNQLSEHVIS